MRKVMVVALREYNAAVRTKAFVIGLVMMPVLMGGSMIAQRLTKDQRDTSERKVAVVDRTPGGRLQAGLKKSVEGYNEHQKAAREAGQPFRGQIVLLEEPAPADSPDAVKEKRDALSARAKAGEVVAWVEIGPGIIRPSGDDGKVIYEVVRLSERDVIEFLEKQLNEKVREQRALDRKLSLTDVEAVNKPVKFEMEQKQSQRFTASILVPVVLMMLMFMLVLMTATPLMQGVVEEKMQRIAEVLLGSVSPFQLMLGKLIGMTAVSLTISAVYLGGAYWAAHRYEMAEHAPVSLILWFLLFQTLASLLFGSLFIAVGAACTDMRETQNLMWPVMLLAVTPMFFLAQVLQAPNSPVVVGLSFFPFATPSVMIARLGMPGGIPWWHPIVGVLGILATTLFCVWAAGRIFRVGILLMGKGASPGEIARWVFRG